MFIAILGIQIVATSLPVVQQALAFRPDQMSWVQTSYFIAEVIAIPLITCHCGSIRHRQASFVLAPTGCAFSGRICIAHRRA
jgi:MFS transporter, DHA2 family, multidrug resistance protein